MSQLYLHIPLTLDPASRIAALNAAFGHPLAQVDENGNPSKNPVQTRQFDDIEAANGDGRVVLIDTLYHLPPAAEKSADGCALYSLRGAVLAGIIPEPEGKPDLEPDLRTIAETMPHQDGVNIIRKFADATEAEAFLVAVGKETKDVEAKIDPQSGAVAVKGVAEEMPIAALDDGAEVIEKEMTQDWPKVPGAKDPSGGFVVARNQ
jgi:hypothetical protein